MDNNYKHKDTKNLVVYFMEQLKEAKKIELQLKEMNKHISEVDIFLANRMIEEKVPKITLEDNGEKLDFQPVDDETFSLDPEKTDYKAFDNPEFFKWLRDNGHEGMIKTKESVHAQSRNKFFKELREDNQPLPGFVKVGFYTHTKFNKSAIERTVK